MSRQRKSSRYRYRGAPAFVKMIRDRTKTLSCCNNANLRAIVIVWPLYSKKGFVIGRKPWPGIVPAQDKSAAPTRCCRPPACCARRGSCGRRGGRGTPRAARSAATPRPARSPACTGSPAGTLAMLSIEPSACSVGNFIVFVIYVFRLFSIDQCSWINSYIV